MLMPSGGIAKYYRWLSDSPIKIMGLAGGRSAAIAPRITKCATPVTLARGDCAVREAMGRRGSGAAALPKSAGSTAARRRGAAKVCTETVTVR